MACSVGHQRGGIENLSKKKIKSLQQMVVMVYTCESRHHSPLEGRRRAVGGNNKIPTPPGLGRLLMSGPRGCQSLGYVTWWKEGVKAKLGAGSIFPHCHSPVYGDGGNGLLDPGPMSLVTEANNGIAPKLKGFAGSCTALLAEVREIRGGKESNKSLENGVQTREWLRDGVGKIVLSMME
jgi:hypothetical protein